MTTSSDISLSIKLEELQIPDQFAPFYTNLPHQNISFELKQEFEYFLRAKYNSYTWYDCAEDTPYDCSYISFIRDKKSDEADIRYYEALEYEQKCNEEYKEEVENEQMEAEDMSTKFFSKKITNREYRRWMKDKDIQEQYDDEGFQQGNYIRCLY